MLLRLIFCTIWIALIPAGMVSGQEVIPLAEDPVYRDGLEALGNELPDLAAGYFEEVLKARKDDDPGLPELRIRLVEALVRSGRLEDALPLLELPDLAEDPRANFWKARAQLSLGHYFEAATTFEKLAGAKDAELRRLATLTRARLLASLGEPAEALPLLDALAKDDEAPETVAEAKLLQASLHLDASDFEAAALLLADAAPTSPTLQKQKQYLEARLALGRHDWSAAASLFRALTEDPRHLSKQLLLGCVLGHADALVGLDKKDEADAYLIAFLDEHRDTELLEPFFARIIPWPTEDSKLDKALEEKLRAWSAPPGAPGDSELRSLGNPVASTLANELDPRPSALSTFALYHLALHLANENNPESVFTAGMLLARLRFENPSHPLALASLLETGRLHLGNQRPAAALAAIETLEELANPGPLKAEAADLAARIRFADGDYAKAAEAFTRAGKNFQGNGGVLTTINQGLCLLMSGQENEFSELFNALDSDEAMSALELERALLKASKRDPEARPLLDAFLHKHPSHQRTAEARLAVAELAVGMDPLDLSMALAQLDSVDPGMHPRAIALRHLLVRLKLGELTGDWEDAIAEATEYLRTHDAPEETALLLKLGEAFYLNGNYNQARMRFQQAAEPERGETHREVALFFAAKSAMRVGTANARADGIELLQEVSAQNGPLAAEARLQLGRAYIDIGENEKALDELEPLLAPDAKSSSKIEALMLAADAHRAIGGEAHLSQCMEIYDGLLVDPETPYALNNQVHRLKGHTLELLNQPGEALEAYYRVITMKNLPAGEPVTEWKWFYDCGFSALRLLEESKRWRSAYRVAIILQEAGGYRWKEAADHAKSLQLEHHIWDDVPPAGPQE